MNILDAKIELELIAIKKLETAIGLYHVYGNDTLKRIPEVIHNDIIEANNSLSNKEDLFSFEYTNDIRVLAIRIYDKYKPKV